MTIIKKILTDLRCQCDILYEMNLINDLYHIPCIFSFLIVKVEEEWRNRDEVEKLVSETVETKAGSNHKICCSGGVFIVFTICRPAVLPILSAF